MIIDDEQPAINVLKNYIRRLSHLKLIATETNPLSGIETIKAERPDLVFLDIQMDEMNGIEVMKIISDYTKVIFCTAYSEFAVTSSKFGPIATIRPFDLRYGSKFLKGKLFFITSIASVLSCAA